MQETDEYAALLSEEGRYGLLVEAVTDYAIYMLNTSGIVTSWNPGAERFKGYKAAEIIGRHFSTFYTDEDRAAGLPARALETAWREGKFETEGWRLRKDGSRFWAYVVIDPIRLSSGALVGFAKITRDLTERRAAEELLRRSEEQFRVMVQGVTDYAIYFLSPEGTVSSWNGPQSRLPEQYSCYKFRDRWIPVALLPPASVPRSPPLPGWLWTPRRVIPKSEHWFSAQK